MSPGRNQLLPWEQQDAPGQPGGPRVSSGISQTSEASLLPREGAQRQQRLSHSGRNSVCPGRGRRHQLANWVTGEKQAQVPWDAPDTGEANGFWLLCGVFK